MIRPRHETQLVLPFEVFIVMIFPSVLNLKGRALPKEIGFLTSHSIPAIAGPGIYSTSPRITVAIKAETIKIDLR
jgi:hypothetical protein